MDDIDNQVEQGTDDADAVDGDRREKFTRFVRAVERVLEHAKQHGEVYDGAVADHTTITDVLEELRAELGGA